MRHPGRGATPRMPQRLNEGMMRKAISATEAAALVPDGASLLYGGFMGVGTPQRLVDALVERGVRGLTDLARGI
jgi:acyl CoA:acetate/3-ketoacid CoA transferase alpha subunit